MLARALAAQRGDPRAAFAEFEARRLARTRRVQLSSRRIGRIAQIGSPPLAALRDALLRLAPASSSERHLRWLLEVEL